MFNPNWPVWIVASVTEHFAAKAQTKGITLFCDGDDRATEGLTEYAELRLLGPMVAEPSLNAFHLTVDANILITVKRSATNVYRPHEIAGWFMEACYDVHVYDKGRTLTPDPVPKPNDYVSDAYSVQFHLSIPRDTRVRWNYIGQPENNTNVLQGIVSVKFEVKLP